MKLFTYLCCLLSLAFLKTNSVSAQADPEDKMSVAVLPFTSSTIVKAEDVETIYGQVTEAFVNARRFTIIERKNHAAVFAELEQQKQEIYMNNNKLAKQGMQMGANYLILGDVGAGGSNSAVSVTLKLVDVETSEIIASKNISSDNSGAKATLAAVMDAALVAKTAKNGYTTGTDAAINSTGKNAINNLSVNTLDIGRRVKNFINEYFPLNSKIISIEGQKGDEAQKVLISIGENMSLKKGQTLYVFEETVLEAGGKKLRRKTQLGKIRIESIEGGVSVCKVSDGGEAILKKFAGREVYVSTNQSK